MVIITVMVPIMPRFVLNIRDMHGREIQNRLQGIDTAFGLSSHPIASRDTETPAVVFADGAKDWAMLEGQRDEEIQLEVIKGGLSR